jgi:hypothetical protein
VLKSAHHGSRNETDAKWLSIVKPHLAVISVGEKNEYGHPSPQTLALLSRMRIPVLRTDQNGTLDGRTGVDRGNILCGGPAGHGPGPRLSAAPERGPRPEMENEPGPRIRIAVDGNVRGLQL